MFKLRFKSSPSLSSDIERNASEIKRMLDELGQFSIKLEELFKTLREAKNELSKAAVLKASIKEEEHPRLSNLYKRNEELVARLNQSAEQHVKKFLSVLDSIAKKLSAVAVDADALFYREDKRLTELAHSALSSEDEGLRHKTVVLVNEVKETIKSMTLKLFEASRLEEEKVMLYPSKRKITELPERIKELGAEIKELEKVSESPSTAGILESAVNQIGKLKAVALNALVLMSSVDRHFAKLKEKVYLLEEDVSRKTLTNIISSEKKFKDVKSRISSQAQKLFEAIKTITERK